MRFLQTEWHRHERERNAWQIERAEMRARVVKLEGDLRSSRKLRESMDKHIRMLENVLKTKDESQRQASPKHRDRSRKYLGKCLEEFTSYLHKAPSHRVVPAIKPDVSLSEIYNQPTGNLPEFPPVDRSFPPHRPLQILSRPAETAPTVLVDRTLEQHTQRMARFPETEQWEEQGDPETPVNGLLPFESHDERTSPPLDSSFQFNVKFALRGHLDVVRCVIFTGEILPRGPQLCSAGDDGLIKRWTACAGPRTHNLDLKADETHRGHGGAVLSLAVAPFPSDGRIFSGGQDATIRVWERDRVDSMAQLDGHTDAVWALCILPENTLENAAGKSVLVSGSADGTVLIWTFPSSQQDISSARRAKGTSRRANSISSGSTATISEFHHNMVHRIAPLDGAPAVTAISAHDSEHFLVAYADASVVKYQTRDGSETARMASRQSYDGSRRTAVNALVGGKQIASGHEDCFVRLYAEDGLCTHSMLAHPAPISALSLSSTGSELVSAGHDASLRLWDLESRSCIQEIAAHRIMRGEGVCSVAWSADGQWIASAGGDGVVKVFARMAGEAREAFDGDLANGIDIGEDDDGWRF